MVQDGAELPVQPLARSYEPTLVPWEWVPWVF